MFIIDFKPLDFDLMDITDLNTLLNYDIVADDAFNNECALINQIELLFNLDFNLIDNNGTNKTVINLIELFNSEKAFYKAFETIIIQMTYNYLNNLFKEFIDDIKDDLESYDYLSEYYFYILDISNKEYSIMSNTEKNNSIKTYIVNNFKLDNYLEYDFIQTLNLSIRFI